MPCPTSEVHSERTSRRSNGRRRQFAAAPWQSPLEVTGISNATRARGEVVCHQSRRRSAIAITPATPAAEISGVSFWAWAGEGRPRTPGGFWQLGDALLGDPPHERQGWYSVYDEDREMSQLITRTAARIHANASAFYA